MNRVNYKITESHDERHNTYVHIGTSHDVSVIPKLPLPVLETYSICIIRSHFAYLHPQSCVLYIPLPPCTAVDVCDLPMVVGPCDAAIPSWFYNSESGECEIFTYGGCGGNDNRFDTRQACEAQCDDDGKFLM